MSSSISKFWSWNWAYSAEPEPHRATLRKLGYIKLAAGETLTVSAARMVPTNHSQRIVIAESMPQSIRGPAPATRAGTTSLNFSKFSPNITASFAA